MPSSAYVNLEKVRPKVFSFLASLDIDVKNTKENDRLLRSTRHATGHAKKVQFGQDENRLPL